MRKRTAEIVWSCEAKRTGRRGKKSNGVGALWRKWQAGDVNAKVGGLWGQRHGNVGAAGEDGYDRERWRKLVSATAIPHGSGIS